MEAGSSSNDSGSLPFPIYCKDARFDATAASGTYYLVTGDGLFLERQSELFTASVPADQVAGLQPHRAALTLHVPRLPIRLLEQTWGFFRAVYEKWRGEAIVVMFYAPATRRFDFRAPPQRIRGRKIYGQFYADLHLDYGNCERPGPEFVKLGTFHSHADAAAGHSRIDMHDELYESGLHITAGYVHTSWLDLTAAFVVSGTRFPLRTEDILPPLQNLRPPPQHWMKSIEVIDETSRRWT